MFPMSLSLAGQCILSPVADRHRRLLLPGDRFKSQKTCHHFSLTPDPAGCILVKLETRRRGERTKVPHSHRGPERVHVTVRLRGQGLPRGMPVAARSHT